MPACVHARAESILHTIHARGQLWRARAQDFTPSDRGFRCLGVTDFTRSGVFPSSRGRGGAQAVADPCALAAARVRGVAGGLVLPVWVGL